MCLVLEAMADGGVMMGLPREGALELAAQSKFFLWLSIVHRERADRGFECVCTAMQGAARMVLQTGMHPAALKDSVTSKLFRAPLFLQDFNELTNFVVRSSGRLYDCWIVGTRGWESEIDRCEVYSSDDGARCGIGKEVVDS